MKINIIALITLLTLSMSSCISIEEVFTLQRDGSGTISYRIDMSEMMESLKAFDTDSTSIKNAAETETIDTVFTMYSIAENEGYIDKVSNPELLKKITTNASGDKQKEEVDIKMLIQFDSPEQLVAISKTMNELDSIRKEMESKDTDGMTDKKDPLSQLSKLSGGSNIQYVVTKKTVQRMGMEDEDNPFNEMSEEEKEQTIGMMEMMFSSAKYTVTYNLPGKIKKIANESSNTKTEGTQIVQEFKFLDIITGTADVANLIKFK